MTRNTKTGQVLEFMVLPSLDLGGYSYETQVNIGHRPGGGKHYVDVVAAKDEAMILISLKWQQVSGTAEQKVPFEVICLMAAMRQHSDFRKAYLVLGGSGWKLRDWYLSGELNQYLNYESWVTICPLEQFIGQANSGKL
ncbi:hypothetical protein PN441_07370 [Spirulina major CS-329]|jgi:hypothetical protein|uniref:PD-(D/E)XK nuclease superfamily protein n=1 Tax=Spirulina TaxID=1154 RepID=UPI00232CF2C1|nr:MULTISPECIES: PD-(D/E)XK nuclease superfamily protein [Spirulina]MDB9496806.1 hypothetical protein [Spirulina subsalsa CS-330]MDB9502887.1 hypothetical protein [Spirulina major CS-329]